MGLRSSESKSRGVSSATSDGESNHITGLWYPSLVSRASLIAQVIKNLPAKQEAPVQFLGWEDSWEKGVTICNDFGAQKNKV